MRRFLDYDGLSYFWNQVKFYIDKKMQDNFTCPDNIFEIKLSAYPQDGGTIAGDGYVTGGTECKVVASTDSSNEYVFVGWEEDGKIVDYNSEYKFAVNENRSLTAKFIKSPKYIAGIHWHEVELPTGVNPMGIAYGDGKFVIVGGYGKGLYSYDGIHWIETSLPVGYVGNSWHAVAYGNSKFVAIQNGNSNSIIYSNDGIDWELVTLPVITYMYDVSYGNGVFVVDANGYIFYSYDGIVWQSLLYATPNHVRFLNDRFYTIGGKIANLGVSKNGIDFETLPTPSSSYNWTDIAYGKDKYILISTHYFYYMDFVQWKLVPITPSSYPNYLWKRIIYNNDKFVVIPSSDSTASSSCAYSYDGFQWYATNLPQSATWRDIVFADGKFIAIASSPGKMAISYTGNDILT